MSSKFYFLTISMVEQLTDDAISITFDVPRHLQEKFAFKQGQHITLKAMINDKEVRRSYSICSGVVEQQLQIAIKRIEGGCFSTFANKEFVVGIPVEVMPPQGHFFNELSPQSKNNYLFIAVGSGITPIISHIQSILDTEKNAGITLIYGNKTPESTMFDEKLTLISQVNTERFKRINIYSQALQINELLNGRICAQKFNDFDKALLINISSFTYVYLCGPANMITELITCLKTYGVTEDRIFYELFYLDDSNNTVNQTDLSSSVENDTLSQVTVISDSSSTTFALSKIGENILDATIELGADLPFACKVGVCASCKAKVMQGEVKMDVNHSLTEEEVQSGFILVCQSHPVSDEVTIDFDFD